MDGRLAEDVMVRSLAVLRIHVYLIRPAPIVVGSRFEEEPAIILKLSGNAVGAV